MKGWDANFGPPVGGSPDARVLVVGASHAGATTARMLRSLGYSGHLTLVSDEAHRPYERPPLSKGVVAKGDPAIAGALFKEEELTSLDIAFHPGRRMVTLDVERRRAYDACGGHEAYDICVLATGGVARELPDLPRGSCGVHYVRTLDDALGLADDLKKEGPILVIGAGYLGLEIASSVTDMGRDVTLLDMAPHLLSRSAPPLLADWLRTRCEWRDIRLLLGKERLTTVYEDGGYTVTLRDGEQLRAALIVVAVGQQPNVALARSAGVALDSNNGGVLVDECARTSIEGIYAVGDCTSQWHDWYGSHVRLESWQSANEQGAIAASAIMGMPGAVRSVPWYWTDVLGCNVQMLGSAPDTNNTGRYVVRGECAATADRPRFLLLGMEGDRLKHVVAINAGGKLGMLRPLVETGDDVDASLLVNQDRPLRAIVKSMRALGAGHV